MTIFFKYLVAPTLLILLLSVKTYSNDTINVDNAEVEWKYSGNFSQTFNQIKFSNWAAGGESSFNSTTMAELEAKYENENFSFENVLDLRYGLHKAEEQSLRKSDDRIDLTSKIGREFAENFKYSAMMNFKTQFSKGYNYPNDSVAVSKFMAPGFLTTSIGIDYKPWDFLSVFFSPVAGRFTFVLDQEIADINSYGVEESKSMLAEVGGMVSLSFNKRLFEDIRLRSKVDLFNSYKDPGAESWKNSVINWETTLNFKLTDYITANFLFHLIHDHNISVPVYETVNGEEIQIGEEKLQVKQTFGLGFAYSF